MMRWIGMTAIISLVLFLGCKDDKKENSNLTGTGTPHDGTLNASISGDFTSNFQCTTAYSIQGTADTSQGISGTMHIQGTVIQGSDTITIDINIYHNPATGTYQLVFPAVDGVCTIGKNHVLNLSESGSVTFNQVSTSRMTGTFDFTAFRINSSLQKVTVTVTSGTFDVPVIATGP